jgi:hypothetical protein
LTFWSAFYACERTGGGRVEEDPVTVYRALGRAVRVPAGATVEATAERFAVDRPDGRSWFDLTWHPATAAPADLIATWARENCAPMVWDQAGEPYPRALHAGGLCTREPHRYWAILLVEPVEGGWLRSSWLSDHNRLPYEDAWVEALRTTFSLQAGDAPWPEPDAAEIRRTLRSLGPPGPAERPMPGGGTLSTRSFQALAPHLLGRRAGLPGLPAPAGDQSQP